MCIRDSLFCDSVFLLNVAISPLHNIVFSIHKCLLIPILLWVPSYSISCTKSMSFLSVTTFFLLIGNSFSFRSSWWMTMIAQLIIQSPVLLSYKLCCLYFHAWQQESLFSALADSVFDHYHLLSWVIGCPYNLTHTKLNVLFALHHLIIPLQNYRH